MHRRLPFSSSLLALCLLAVVPASAQAPTKPADDFQVVRTRVGDVPVLVIAPKETRGRHLVIWLPGFGGDRNSSEAQLRDLARNGFVAMSYDPYQCGERRIESQAELGARVVGNLKRYFWPILAHSSEDVPPLIDWAIKEFGVSDKVGMGGTSAGGDMSCGAAAVDKRIVAVSAIVGTPDWRRPGSYQPQGEADPLSQADLDRCNPMQHLDRFRHHPAIAFQSGAKDMRVPPEAAQRFTAALRPMYGKDADRLRVNLYDVGHGFVPAMWDASLQWFHKYLP